MGRAPGETPWRAGLARAVITPPTPLQMAGYAGREAEAEPESKLHDLWVKVLALESPEGRRGVVVSTDLCGISHRSWAAICDGARVRCGLDRSQLKITCTHTHTGPLLRGCYEDFNPMIAMQRQDVHRYTDDLECLIVEKVAEALEGMSPATLRAGDGSTGFAVNRRAYSEAEVPAMLESGLTPRGPVDHAVPLLAVRGIDGELRALLFGYACHTTTLNTLQWSGDYAGFAMVKLESDHPGVQAMFYQGCGADQNPLPRRSVDLCRRYGFMLATAVDQALGAPGRPIGPRFGTAFEHVDLDFERMPTLSELESEAERGGYKGRWAVRQIEERRRGREPAPSAPYPVQVWNLGEQLWISLGGEVVVDYALRYRARYGSATWVHGYTHDMVGHVPSRRVWDEGGYEAGHNDEFDQPAERRASDVEDRITAAVDRLVAATA